MHSGKATRFRWLESISNAPGVCVKPRERLEDKKMSI
jgi:hypothetical protein